jgi:hypothetical protein
LLRNRLKEIRWLWPAWLLSLLVGLAFYGTSPGNISLGLAMALHAVIICDAGRMRVHIEHPVARVLTVVIVFFILQGTFYGVLTPTVRHVRAAAPLSSDGIAVGDHLLFRTGEYDGKALERGDIVLYQLQEAQIGHAYLRGGNVMGKVLGLPDETLTFSAGKMTVTSPDRAPRTFAAPPELGSLRLVLRIPADNVFCLPPPVTTYEANLGAPSQEATIRATGLARTAAVYGRLLMVYNPILRIRWTHGSPLQEIPGSSDEPIRESGIRGSNAAERAETAE